MKCRRARPRENPVSLGEGLPRIFGGKTLKVKVSFPNTKISEAFLEFAEPYRIFAEDSSLVGFVRG